MPDYLRCSAYCTADSYDIQGFTQYLIENGFEPQYFDDIVFSQKTFLTDNKKIIVDILHFPFGVTVIWGGNESEEKIILDDLKVFESKSLSFLCKDVIYYSYDFGDGKKTHIDEEKNEVFLASDSIFEKLSISYALAQSVKLDILEKSVTKLLENTAPLQQELAETGKVSLSKKELSKQIGILFNARYSINLHSDILDTPEFFWRRPSYEPLYLAAVGFQDIQLRQTILNRRLDMIHEVYNILSNELNYIHSTRLETIIVILIAIEVLMAIVHNNVFDNIFKFFM